MARNRTLNIEVVLDEKGAVKGIKSLDGAVKSLEKQSDKTGKAGFSLGQSFNMAVGNLMASAIQATGRAIKELARQGLEMIGRGSELIETQNKFNVVFGTSTKKVDEFLDVWANMAGLTKAVGQEMTSTSAFILQGIGVSKDASADLSIQIAKTAGDLTSFMNVPAEQTFRAINSALLGERERLKLLGVTLSEEEIKVEAYSQTGKKLTQELTKQEKVLATLTLITKKAGPAMGDLEATQFEVAAQTRQFTARVEDLKDMFAGELIPGVKDTITELNKFSQRDDVSKFVKEMGKAVAESLSTALDLIISTIDFLVKYNGEIKEAAQITAILTAALIAYRTAVFIATIAQKGLNLAMALNPVGAVVAAITILIGLMYKFRKEIADVAAKWLRFFGIVVNGVSSLLTAVEKLGIFSGAVKGLKGLVDDANDSLATFATRLDDVGESATSLPGVGDSGSGANSGSGSEEEIPPIIDDEALKNEAERIAKSTQLFKENNSLKLAQLAEYHDAVLLLEKEQTATLLSNEVNGSDEFFKVAQARAAKLLELKQEQEADVLALTQEFSAAELAYTAEVEGQEKERLAEMDAEFLATKQEQNAALLALQQEHMAILLEAGIANAEAQEALSIRVAEAKEEEARRVQSAVLDIIQSNLSESKSAKEALASVLNSVRSAIKARLAESIATQIAKIIKTVPFPFNIGIAAAAGAGMSMIFNAAVPKFERGVRGFSGGRAIVGERGPEEVILPRGSHVIPNAQSNLGGSGGGVMDLKGVIKGEDIWIVNQRITDRYDRGGLS